MSLDDCKELITLYECSEEGKEQKKLSFDGEPEFTPYAQLESTQLFGKVGRL